MASPTAAATPTPSHPTDPTATSLTYPVDPSGMTIPQIKQALMEGGHEADVWALANNKKAKKADWVALARARIGG